MSFEALLTPAMAVIVVVAIVAAVIGVTVDYWLERRREKHGSRQWRR